MASDKERIQNEMFTSAIDGNLFKNDTFFFLKVISFK